MPFCDRRVVVDGRRVVYVDEGPRDARPVLLLHGGAFDHAELTWKRSVANLRDRHRLIVPDLPGYGGSEGFGAAHDLARLGRWTVAFLDAVGVARAVVAGVSMGGGMALWLALHHPGRVAAALPCGAYGLMPRAPLHGMAHAAFRRVGLAPLYAAATLRPLTRVGLVATYASARNLRRQAIDDVVAAARDQCRRRTFDGFLRAEMTPTGFRHDLTGRLDEITVPTTLVHGRADRIVPVIHARRAAPRLPRGHLVELPTGHWPMRERPDLFDPILSAVARDPSAFPEHSGASAASAGGGAPT